MPSPEDLTPERLDALIDGGAPLGDEEEALAALVSELRATEEAPPELRARVRAIARPREPQARRRLFAALRATSWRGRAMALAPVCVLIAAAAVAVTSTRDSGPQPSRAADTTAQATAPPAERQATAPTPAPSGGAEGNLTITQGALTIRVPDPAAVEAAVARAREIAASLGGRAVRQSYRGGADGPTVASVTLELPVGRYDEARAGLTAVGKVLEESAEFAGPAGPVERPETPAAAGTATVRVTFVTP